MAAQQAARSGKALGCALVESFRHFGRDPLVAQSGNEGGERQKGRNAHNVIAGQPHHVVEIHALALSGARDQRGEESLHMALVCGEQQVFLAFEIQVHRPLGQPRSRSHLGHAGDALGMSLPLRNRCVQQLVDAVFARCLAGVGSGHL